MANSKTVVRPYFPKDFSTQLVEKSAAAGAALTPGTLVVEVDGLIVACDTDTALHTTLPVYMVWTDGSSRTDIQVYQLDGTSTEMYTCIAGVVKADVAAAAFSATPVAGDLLLRSATAGLIDPLSEAEYTTLLGTTVAADQRVVGRVEAVGGRLAGAGFFNCTLNLA